MLVDNFNKEIKSGERFGFGKNWQHFLTHLNEERITVAEKSLVGYLGDVSGKTFLDIGSGSGLFSLAARRLGAKVFSFDYDTDSVACTLELKNRYFPNDENWTVCQNSALDKDFLNTLGQFDIVYSWGVLHHTGKMWEALANVEDLVKKNGQLFIAIYNDQGWNSKYWTFHKKNYNALPFGFKQAYGLLVMGSREVYSLFGNIAMLKLARYIRYWTHYASHSGRGMSYWHDKVDWIGGYPFEVAMPEQIFDFFRARGFVLDKLKTCGGGIACNEFVFRKSK